MENGKLKFNEDRFDVRMCGVGGLRIEYRCYEDVFYCANPSAPIQRLNIYTPVDYYRGGTFDGYDLKNAPIFLHVPVKRNRPGGAMGPGLDSRNDVNTLYKAFMRGFVVVSVGLRGRTLPGGKVPAPVVDLKAAIRFLRCMKEVIPGDTERIIVSGSSNGGGYAVIAGVSGGRPEFDPYLAEIGAADERDDVFGVNAFCPVCDLAHADMAYEWMFGGEGDAASEEIRAAFPPYLNSLGLADPLRGPLTLRPDGSGAFRDYVEEQILLAAQREYETHDNRLHRAELVAEGSEVEKQSGIVLWNGRACALDWRAFAEAVGRRGEAPVFDRLDLSSPTNDAFGTGEAAALHFTDYSFRRSRVGGGLADPAVVRLLDPYYFLENGTAAPNWRIRQGTHDRFVSAASPVMLAKKLEAAGRRVDMEFTWGIPHTGDYDHRDLFDWIDGLACSENA